MSKNRKYIYEGIPHEFYEGEMSDLGYKSGEELIENALKRFKAAVSKINKEVLGYDLDIPE